MVYRVYSDNCGDLRTQFSHDSWLSRKDIKHIGVSNKDLARHENGLPYLKDILDVGYKACEDDADIILYTNTDIGVASDIERFPSTNFFCVRKNVEEYKDYTQQNLSTIPYEDSINCDAFGITKKWYRENKNKIPDFLIGSPTWDLSILLMINGVRFNNAIFHIAHVSPWKKVRQSDYRHQQNERLYINFLKENYPNFIKSNNTVNVKTFINYLVEKFCFNNFIAPLFITFYTPSHKCLYDLFYNSFKRTLGENYSIVAKQYEEQLCKTATYHKKGWRGTQVKKLNHIINVVKQMQRNEELNRTFIFCDADIVILKDFIQDIEEQLNDCDLVAQQSFSSSEFKDHPLCSGFFAGKPTEKVIKFLEKIYYDLVSNTNDDTKGDQYFLNKNSVMLKIKPLSEKYFSPGYTTQGNILKPEQFDIINSLPKDINLVHANYIVEIKNKELFLNGINDLFNRS